MSFFLRVFLISTSLLLCSMSGARAEAGEGEVVVISCDVNMRWGFVGPISEAEHVVLESASRTRQDINTSDLIEYGPQDKRGNSHRLRSKSTKRSCGPFVIELSAGWFNPDAMGASGSDDIAVIKISRNGKNLLGPIRLSNCATDCATTVTLGWDENGVTGHFGLHRDYEERIEWK